MKEWLILNFWVSSFFVPDGILGRCRTLDTQNKSPTYPPYQEWMMDPFPLKHYHTRHPTNLHAGIFTAASWELISGKRFLFISFIFSCFCLFVILNNHAKRGERRVGRREAFTVHEAELESLINNRIYLLNSRLSWFLTTKIANRLFKSQNNTMGKNMKGIRTLDSFNRRDSDETWSGHIGPIEKNPMKTYHLN